ncbi:MAG: hypothetical protein M0036_22040 [Desulfobacteraceae bacterium]|nr:hypothetical protein [Desulfobacteraceae bacterium]
MQKRPITISYIIFYILFWPDTYRILIGFLAAVVLAPYLLSPGSSIAASAMLHLMVAAIGYAASAAPAKRVAGFFRKQILKGKN